MNSPRFKQLRFADDDACANGVDVKRSTSNTDPLSARRIDSSSLSTDAEQGSRSQQGGVRVDIGRGETVGELAVLVRARTRTSTAVCVRDCELVRISQEGFLLISSKYPTVTMHFTRVLARRYDGLLRRIAGGGSSSRDRSAAAVGGFLSSRNAVHMPRAPSAVLSNFKQQQRVCRKTPAYCLSCFLKRINFFIF